MSAAGTSENPLRVAIVGSGPAGFYAADQLIKRDGVHVAVDMFDRLPTPFGLVRGGVAPDHPKLKSVIRVYERTAGEDSFRFFGNVKLGDSVGPDDLAQRFHAVIWSVGAETDRHLGIPGEDLPGSHSATSFVGWYNAHPDYADRSFDLSTERAIVIGNGNVAMDVTRILALSPDELAKTDIADHGLEALRECRVREIVVLGRRGPAQAAFTNPEIKELGELPEADVIVDPKEIQLDPLSAAFLESDEADMTSRRNVEILQEFAAREPEGRPKRIVLRFLASPVEISGEGKVESVTIGRNELVEDESGALRAKDTGKRETLDCGLVLRSVGYKGLPIEGLPFDERRGVIPNEAGRVLDRDRNPVPGHYAAGWIKRGPSGVIGTNKKDAQETVDSLFEDFERGALPDPDSADPDGVEQLLAERDVDYVTYAGWGAIDEAEVERGKPHGRPRVKFVSVEEMLEAAAKADKVSG